MKMCPLLGPRICITIFLTLAVHGSRGLSEEHQLESEGRRSTNITPHASVKTTIKTEYGDIIDCIDIHKQPAFDHPLLKNHKIQIQPSDYPNGRARISKQAQSKNLESLGFRELCPDGSVPIRRILNKDSLWIESAGNTLPGDNQPDTHFATLRITQNTTFPATSASINIQNPNCSPGESSAAQLWLSDGTAQDRNLIAVGWMVDPTLYGDNRTRFSTYWAGHGSGCYDLQCPGFVQINRNITLGDVIPYVSVPGGGQYDLFINIYQDPRTKHWWLLFTDNGLPIGYWPNVLFSQFGNGATRLDFGGRVVGNSGQPSPVMGSGRVPDGHAKYLFVSYFSKIQYVDGLNRIQKSPSQQDVDFFKDCPSHYGVEFYPNSVDMGANFLYGGPSGQCP